MPFDLTTERLRELARKMAKDPTALTPAEAVEICRSLADRYRGPQNEEVLRHWQLGMLL